MTRIPWADETWNPMTGCTPVSEACVHCYAERMAKRFNRYDREVSWWCPTCGWPGEPEVGYDKPLCSCGSDTPMIRRHFAPTFHPDRLDKPLHWRKPRRIFVCSMSDLFHEAFTGQQINEVWRVMFNNPRHTFMVLTKRPERLRLWTAQKATATGWPEEDIWPDWMWLGVTVENGANRWRLDILKDTPAAVRFVSYEPALGPFGEVPSWLDWVIVGGENGPGARPMQPEWARDVWRQCKAAGVAFFWKQEGSASAIPPHKPYTKMIATREFPEATHD